MKHDDLRILIWAINHLAWLNNNDYIDNKEFEKRSIKCIDDTLEKIPRWKRKLIKLLLGEVTTSTGI